MVVLDFLDFWMVLRWSLPVPMARPAAGSVELDCIPPQGQGPRPPCSQGGGGEGNRSWQTKQHTCGNQSRPQGKYNFI